MGIKKLALSSLVTLSVAFGGILGAASANTADGQATIALVGARLIDGHGGVPIENAVVLIAGDKILSVGTVDTLAVQDGIKVINVNGMTILPGLWESHGHLFHVGEGDPNHFPGAFAAQSKEVMAAVAKINLMSGITSFRDTGGPLKEQVELRQDIEAGRLPGPRLYLSGPIIRQGKPSPGWENCSGASCVGPYVSNAKEARSAVDHILNSGANQIKVYGFWDLDLLTEVVKAAHARGVGVDADVRHVRAYLTAVEAGVDRLHHVFFADPLVDYSDEELRIMIRGVKPAASGPFANILRGPYILPTVQMREAYVRARNYPEMLDHPQFKAQYSESVYNHIRETWEHPGSIPWGVGADQRVPIAKEKLRRFIEFGGRDQIVAGTDAGSPLNVHSPLTREMRNLHEAGLTAMEVIQSATLRAAEMQGVSDVVGSVKAGKYADLVIVDGDPLQDMSVVEHRIVLIIKNGEVFQPEKNFQENNH